MQDVSFAPVRPVLNLLIITIVHWKHNDSAICRRAVTLLPFKLSYEYCIEGPVTVSLITAPPDYIPAPNEACQVPALHDSKWRCSIFDICFTNS
jgi:hypothetical protein